MWILISWLCLKPADLDLQFSIEGKLLKKVCNAIIMLNMVFSTKLFNIIRSDLQIAFRN